MWTCMCLDLFKNNSTLVLNTPYFFFIILFWEAFPFIKLQDKFEIKASISEIVGWKCEASFGPKWPTEQSIAKHMMKSNVLTSLNCLSKNICSVLFDFWQNLCPKFHFSTVLLFVKKSSISSTAESGFPK